MEQMKIYDFSQPTVFKLPKREIKVYPLPRGKKIMYQEQFDKLGEVQDPQAQATMVFKLLTDVLKGDNPELTEEIVLNEITERVAVEILKVLADLDESLLKQNIEKK